LEINGGDKMTLNQLYYFQTVAHLLNYHHASEVLNVTQPALSNAISNLQAELGVELFHRKGRSIELTKYGAAYSKEIQKILKDLEDANMRIIKMGRSSGHIDLAYIDPTMRWFVPQKVRQFLNQKGNENVTFSLNPGLSSQIVRGIKDGSFDVAFCMLVNDEKSLEFIPIAKQKLVAIVPLNHPLAERYAIDLLELEPYPMIGYNKHITVQPTDKYYEQVAMKPNFIMESTSEDGIASLVEAEFGVAFIAKVDILDHLAVKILPIINPPDCHRNLYMVYDRSKYQIPAVKNFIHYMKKEKLFRGFEHAE